MKKRNIRAVAYGDGWRACLATLADSGHEDIAFENGRLVGIAEVTSREDCSGCKVKLRCDELEVANECLRRDMEMARIVIDKRETRIYELETISDNLWKSNASLSATIDELNEENHTLRAKMETDPLRSQVHIEPNSSYATVCEPDGEDTYIETVTKTMDIYIDILQEFMPHATSRYRCTCPTCSCLNRAVELIMAYGPDVHADYSADVLSAAIEWEKHDDNAVFDTPSRLALRTAVRAYNESIKVSE